MTKDELLQYRDLAREVRQLRRHLDSLESSMYTPQGQRYTATPRAASGPGKTMADAVCQHMELEDLYREKLAERNAQLLQVEAAIDSLANPGERMIMRYRYVDGYSWTRICGELGYSERTVYRLHGQALLKLKEV